MNLPYRLSERARRDVRNVCAWLETKQKGLAHEFIADLRGTLDKVGERPNSFPKLTRAIRATRCDRFSYRIYFRPAEHAVEVLAVYHTSRHPRRWSDRDRE